MPKKSEDGYSSRAVVLFAAVGVRLLFIAHNVLSTWRVVLAHDDTRFWALVLTNFLTVAEGIAVIRRNGGREWQW